MVLKFFNAEFEDLEIDFEKGTTSVSVDGAEIALLRGNMLGDLGADDFMLIA